MTPAELRDAQALLDLVHDRSQPTEDRARAARLWSEIVPDSYLSVHMLIASIVTEELDKLPREAPTDWAPG